MKIKFLPLVAALFAMTPIVTSCLDNDEVVINYGSETSITGFKLGTLRIDRIGKDKNGKDSAYVDTINCSGYPFTINQQTRTIENKDSLPVGVHLDKVLTSITADTEIIAYEKNGQDTTWTSTDSINFTVTADHSLRFRVYTYDFKKGNPYTVKINRHTQDPDSISWKNFDGMQFGNQLIKQKAFFSHNTLFVLGENTEKKPACFYATIENGTPSAWTEIDMAAPIKAWDTNSAVLWESNDHIVVKAKDMGDTDQLGMIKLSDRTFSLISYEAQISTLLGSGYINNTENDSFTECLFFRKTYGGEDRFGYFLNDGSFTADQTQTDLFDKVAGASFFTATKATSHNSSLFTTTLLAHNKGAESGDTCAVVFSRLSNETEWKKFDTDGTSGCPNLKDIVMIPYNKKFYALGGENDSKAKTRIKPFEAFYVSSDYGRTWQKASRKEYLPTYFAERYDTSQPGCFSCCADNSEGNHFIWIVWKDGKITRGRINHLGFLPKW